MTFKKLLSVLISLAAALFAVCAISVCAGAEKSGDYEYSVLDDGTVEITGYTGSATDLTIPSTLDGKSVTRIRICAFWNCESLTSITIPDSVTSIDDSGFFYGCSSLTSINVDDNNEYFSSQDGVLFNKDMTMLLTFPGGKAGEYVIPDGVACIGDSAFIGCSNLTSIDIPDSVTSIGADAFGGCSSLISITVDDNNVYYFSQDGVLFNKALSKLLAFPGGKAGEYVIPDGVTSIGSEAFYHCLSLTSITIPDSVTSIGEWAFNGCSSLKSIKIPNGVTRIGDGAFSGCSSLTSITIPNGVTRIGDGTFPGCSSLTSITIPNGVTNIGSSAFSGCSSLTSITIPDGVTSIGSRAFSGCSSLKSINIPNGVTSIGSFTFSGTPILDNQTTTVKYVGKWAVDCDKDATTATIKSDTVGIADWAFDGCSSLKSIKIPNGVTRIGDGAFSGCSSLTSITIPNGVTSIGEYAFYVCSSLTSITIPDSITNIGNFAFNYRCENLKDVYYIGSKSQWDKIAIGTYNEYLLGANIHYLNLGISGLNLKGRSGDALRLSWTKNPSADGYIIEMKSGNTWTRVGKITNNSTVEFRKDKLKAGTAYTFRVKAYKMSGKTALYSGYTTISARTNPSAVSGLKLKARAADALRLTWTKNTSADGYIIEMKNGSTWTRVGKITKNSTVEFKKSKLKAGTAYTFRVKAYKMSGKTALYGATKTISVRTNPSTTSGLKLKNSAKNAVRLSWTKNTSADGYIIEMKSGNSWVRVGKVTKNSTVEFKKSKLKAGTAYTFRIKAYKMSGKTALYSGYTTITVKTK